MNIERLLEILRVIIKHPKINTKYPKNWERPRGFGIP
jgi:hypothetical protein